MRTLLVILAALVGSSSLAQGQERYFHIDDFSGLAGGSHGRLVPLEGNQSLWCGARPSGSPPLNGYATLPGYGNDWEEYWQSAMFVVSGDVTVSYLISYDTEPSYDYVRVDYLDLNGTWVNLKSYDGASAGMETGVVPAASHAGVVAFRFRFQSDGAWSDEDGLQDTDGAVIVDSLTIFDSTGLVSYENFESETVGAQATTRGDWYAGTDSVGLIVLVENGTPLAGVESAVTNAGGTVVESDDRIGWIFVDADPTLYPVIAAIPGVSFVDRRPGPGLPLLENARNITGVNAIQGSPPLYSNGLSGNGVVLAMTEASDGGGALPMASHCDMTPRLIVLDGGGISGHAMAVAGIMVSNGSQGCSWNPYTCRGMAPRATLYAWNLNSALSKMHDATDLYGAVASNHSWCNPCEHGKYTSFESKIDELVFDKHCAVFWPAGNSNTSDPSSPHFCNFAPYYTLGEQAAAKNVISVGAVENTTPWAITPISSFGPTADGRLKPDLMAIGNNLYGIPWYNPSEPMNSCIIGGTGAGTSFSSPMAAGIAALLIERYRQLNGGANPSPALLKAVMCNTADDIAPPWATVGPDYKTGYGVVNALRAKTVVDGGNFLTSAIGNGGVHQWSCPVSSGCAQLRVALAWSDPAAAPYANPVLVNDLDLVVISPTSTQRYPLTLNPTLPHANAQEMPNHRDNVEQVVIANPQAGTWVFRVQGYNVPQGPQEYALTWWGSSGCVLGPHADATGPFSCHLKWDTPFCLNQSTASARLEILNDGNAATFSIATSALPGQGGTPGQGCNVMGPTDIEIVGGNTVMVPKFGMAEVTLNITRPPGLTAAYLVGCFDATVTNLGNGTVARCRGSVMDSRRECAVPGGDYYSIGVNTPTLARFDIANTFGASRTFAWRVNAMPSDMASASVVSLNGLSPGTPVTGTVGALGDGDTVTVALTATYVSSQPRRFHDLVLEVDDDFDGAYAPVASAGLYAYPPGTSSGVGDEGRPPKFALHNAVPNPFTSSVSLSFELPDAGHVTAEVYDVRGQRVRRLIYQSLPSGVHTLRWDGRDDAGQRVASGVYWYRVGWKQFTRAKQLVLLR